MRVIDTVNVCLVMLDGGEASVGHEACGVWDHLRAVWRELTTRAKINCSFGFILEEMETKELRYYHSSSNNAAYYAYPKLITMEPMLRDFYDTLEQEDVKEVLIRKRPDTRWRIRMVTNVTFYFFKLAGMGKIGAAPKPKLVKNLKATLTLSKNPRTGKAFEDNLCFFRCLAILLDCKCVGVTPLSKVLHHLHLFPLSNLLHHIHLSPPSLSLSLSPSLHYRSAPALLF